MPADIRTREVNCFAPFPSRMSGAPHSPRACLLLIEIREKITPVMQARKKATDQRSETCDNP